MFSSLRRSLPLSLRYFSSSSSAKVSLSPDHSVVGGKVPYDSSSKGVELFYFALRGRAEQARLLLNDAGIPYTDRLLTQWSLRALKAAGSPISNPDFIKSQLESPLPFGSLPLLKDNDLHLSQTPAILQYLAMKGDKEFNAGGLWPATLVDQARAQQIIAGCEDLFQNYWPIKLDQNRYVYHSGAFPLTPGVSQDFIKFPSTYLPMPFANYSVPRSFRREALPRWLSYFEALIRKNQQTHPNSPYIVGSSRSYADLSLFNGLDAVQTIDSECLEPFPALAKLYETIKNRPNIAKYLKSRPDSGL